MWQKAAEFTEESGTPGKALALPLLGKDSHRVRAFVAPSLLCVAISSACSEPEAQGAEGKPQLPGMPSQVPRPQLVWKVGQKLNTGYQWQKDRRLK